jgi:hypothetical protein
MAVKRSSALLFIGDCDADNGRKNARAEDDAPAWASRGSFGNTSGPKMMDDHGKVTGLHNRFVLPEFQLADQVSGGCSF